MNIVQSWIEKEYENILQWARNATYNHQSSDDLAHDMIEAFMAHPLAEELVAKGDARYFITRMLLNQARSNTSPFNRNHRFKMDYDETSPRNDYDSNWGNSRTFQALVGSVEDYDYETDYRIETIEAICEDIKLETVEGYYCITIFQQLIHQKKLNFSKLAKETNIPRSSISRAYHLAIDMIKNKIEEYHGNNLNS